MTYVNLMGTTGDPEDVLLVIDYHEYDKNAPDGKGAYLGKHVRYWCEGCGYSHEIAVKPYTGQGHSWQWNGDAKLPVLSPSQLMRSYRYPKDPKDQAEMDALFAKGKEQGNTFDVMVASRFRDVCHTFIGINGAPPGHIIWLADCFHDQAASPYCGQVKKLLARKDWPDLNWAKLAIAP